MMKKFFAGSRAFTLIELLIVVAIIAILAAIAVPNFLEAQVRSKVSRAKSDMRSLTTAMEAYYIDANNYPPCNTFGVPGNSVVVGGSISYNVLERLSTPIAYITTGILSDAFSAKYRTGSVYTGTGAQPGMGGTYPANTPDHPFYHSYQYVSSGLRITSAGVATPDRATWLSVPPTGTIKAQAWSLFSCGPDNIYTNMGGVLAQNGASAVAATAQAYCTNLYYDPTNGTVSFGDVFKVGGSISTDYGHYFYQTAKLAEK